MLSNSRKILKEYKNALFSVYLKDTGVLCIEVQSELTYDADDIKQIVNNTKDIAGNNKYLVLVKAGPLSSTTFDALRVLAESESSNYALAKAYVITTISQRLMVNFFLHYFKPKIPIKLFKDAMSAEVWLLKSHRQLLRKVV